MTRLESQTRDQEAFGIKVCCESEQGCSLSAGREQRYDVAGSQHEIETFSQVQRRQIPLDPGDIRCSLPSMADHRGVDVDPDAPKATTRQLDRDAAGPTACVQNMGTGRQELFAEAGLSVHVAPRRRQGGKPLGVPCCAALASGIGPSRHGSILVGTSAPAGDSLLPPLRRGGVEQITGIPYVYSQCMTVAQTLLGLLEAEPAHGYTLKHRYDENFSRIKPLPFGQVYSTLARFERDGLATVARVEQGDGPERRQYAITEQGIETVDNWIYAPELPTNHASSVLFTKVTLALMSGRSADAVLEAQRAVHLERMRVLNTERRESVGLTHLAATYELAHLDADLRWIEEAGQRITKLAQNPESRR